MKKVITTFLIISSIVSLAQNDNTFMALDTNPVRKRMIKVNTLTSGDLKTLPAHDACNSLKLLSSYYTDGAGNMFRSAIPFAGQFMYYDGVPMDNLSAIQFLCLGSIMLTSPEDAVKYGNTFGEILLVKPLQHYDSGHVQVEHYRYLPSFSFRDLWNGNQQGAYEYRFMLNGPVKFSEKFRPLFSLGLTFGRDGEPDPRNTTYPFIEPGYLANLIKTPLTLNPDISFPMPVSETVSDGKISLLPFKHNDNENFLRICSRIVLPVCNHDTIVLGNLTNLSTGIQWVRENALFNWYNNPAYESRYVFSYATWNGKHNTGNGVVKYGLTYANTINKNKKHDRDFKDQFFDYGYIGKYHEKVERAYSYTDTIDGFGSGVFQHIGYYNTQYLFDVASPANPELAAYNTALYDIIADTTITTNELFFFSGGLRNGDLPEKSCYLWNNTGTTYNTYEERLMINNHVSGSIELTNGPHKVSAGFSVSKKSERFYSLAPSGLWTLARNLTNYHLLELNFSNPHLVTDANGVFQDTIYYDRLYSASIQSSFDVMLRNKLGLPVDGTDPIYIDTYLPSDFDIGLFSADELSSQPGFLSYSGYDYTGSSYSPEAEWSDYYTMKDEYGRFVRPVNPWTPLTTAVYAQYAVRYMGIDITAGIRADIYSSNQPVLRDQYLLTPAYTAQEVTSIGGLPVTHPDNIGSDYTVYVDNAAVPNAILGYRKGDFWYNANGEEVSDPIIIASATGVQPYVKDPNQNPDTKEFFDGVFERASPYLMFLPSVHLAHAMENSEISVDYNSHSVNPGNYSAFLPYQYRFLNTYGNIVLNNPDLSPVRVSQVRGGFFQALGEFGEAGLSVFRTRVDGMITIRNITYAYPAKYSTYDNMNEPYRSEGLAVFAQLRGKYVPVTAGAAITLQQSVENDEYRNLTYQKLSYFPKSIVNVNVGYGSVNYNPNRIHCRFFRNFFAGIFANYRSGAEVAGYELEPWVTFDIKAEKSIKITNDGVMATFIISIDNILNRQNLYSAHPETGLPDDDGFLSNPANAAIIHSMISPAAFSEQYRLFINDPTYYGIPRILRFSIRLGF